MYEVQIENYIRGKIGEMIDDISDLIRIDSSLGEATEGNPFGEKTSEALQTFLKKMNNYGFKGTNYENYVISGDMNDKEKGLDILAHLDVVPGGDGWTVTTPFVPLVKDGRLYGRGTSDDKGPAFVALYAMRAIKELGIPLSKNVRLILGGCEECGGNDLGHYYSTEKHAPYTITPDAEFPVINAERGQAGVRFTKTVSGFSDCDIVYFKSGIKSNVVPAKATFGVCGMSREEIESLIGTEAENRGLKIDIASADGYIEILVTGEGCHASTPDLGRNALTGSLELISLLPVHGECADALKKLSAVYPFRDYHGESAGIDMEDEDSGRITSSMDILELKDGILSGFIDNRVPMCATDENCISVLREKLNQAGFDVPPCGMSKVHYVPTDSDYVKSLLNSYEKITGQKKEPLKIGGGTYTHGMPNGVAFGCAEIGLDNHMHGPDEFMVIEDMIKSVRIYADVIINFCS